MVCEGHLRATGTVGGGKGTQLGGPCIPIPTGTDLGVQAAGAPGRAALEAGQGGVDASQEDEESLQIQGHALLSPFRVLVCPSVKRTLKFNIETWLLYPISSEREKN